jgi:polysaccharide biosynthesis protein PslH
LLCAICRLLSENNMKILVVTPEWPYPPDQGGRIRMLNLIKQLSRAHVVTLVSVVDSPISEDEHVALASYTQRAYTLLHPHSVARTAIRVAHSLFTRRLYILDRYCPPLLGPLLDRALEVSDSQVVFLAAHYLANSAAQRLPVPVVVDFHDLAHVLYRRFARGPFFSAKRWHARLQYERMRDFETQVPRRVDACTVTSENDARTLADLSGVQLIDVIPNGVDTVYYTPYAVWPVPAPSPEVVFVGSFDYAPNIQGAQFLCAKVMPVVWQQFPNVKVGLVGRDPSPAVQILAHDPRVIVTGRVNDVRPYLAASKVVVVPLQIGGGTRLKILEAMAMVRPVVSTTVGCEGIQASPGTNILVGDTTSQLASAIMSLLQDQRLSLAIGQSGRRLIETTYDWTTIGRQLEQVLQRVLSQEGQCA